jgi:hypothetical protein
MLNVKRHKGRRRSSLHSASSKQPIQTVLGTALPTVSIDSKACQSWRYGLIAVKEVERQGFEEVLVQLRIWLLT